MFLCAVQMLWSSNLRAFGVFIFPAFVLALSAANILGQGEVQTTPSPTPLLPGTPIERELSASEKHSYRVEFKQGDYAKIIVEQKGIDVVIRVFGPDEKQLAEVDSEMRPNGDEIVELVAKAAGSHRIDVIPRYKLLPAGKYEIRLAEVRNSTESDRSLQEARDQLAESIRLFYAGKYADAQPLGERAVEIRRKALGADDTATAAALTNSARILDAQGKYKEALELNLRILQVREKVLGPDSQDVAFTLNYLGLNATHLEDYQSALSYQERALETREKGLGTTHPAVAVSLINLGIVYDHLGDKLKAGQLYDRALKILEQTSGPENANVAGVVGNIGKIYNDLGDYKKAEPYSVRAAALMEKLYPADNPRIFDALINLAVTYAGLGDLDKAAAIFQRILAFREKNVGPDHPLTAQALYNVANVYDLKGDFAKAEPLYRRSLDIREKTLGAENPSVSEVVSSLALLYAQMGQLDKAIPLQKRAAEIDERNIGLNLTIGSERQKIAFINEISSRINQNLFVQTQFAPSDPVAAELAATTVLRQKGRVLDALSDSVSGLRKRFDEHDRALLDSLNDTTAKLADLILSGPDERTIAEHEKLIKDLSDKREGLEDEISRRAAGVFTRSSPVSLASIQAAIPDDSALIEFAICMPQDLGAVKIAVKPIQEPHYVAYVIHHDGKVSWKDLGAVKVLDTKIAEFRQALRDTKRGDVKAVARSVDEILVRPLRQSVGTSTHLLISPDGELNLIPFEALVDEKGRFLVERFSITYLTSGRDLLKMGVKRESKSPPLIIANPAFGAAASGSDALRGSGAKEPANRRRKSSTITRSFSDTYFAPLSGTAMEAESIRKIYTNALLLEGDKATKASLEKVAAPQLLHIATHGFFLTDSDLASEGTRNSSKSSSRMTVTAGNPLIRSGLALAGANERKPNANDGILTALEASGLDLWGTRLVVLSACDTGVGEIRNGEGVYGLRRSFVEAGAESLVMSLWPVSDTVTRELMMDYYKNLKRGLGRGDSLRQVQLQMLKQPNRQHPFYWASFIQSGDWRAMS